MEISDTIVHGDLELDTLARLPPDATAQLVMAHGAGADIAHAHMAALASHLADQNIATLRFNLPFMQKGGGRPDSVATCNEVFETATRHAAAQSSLPIFVGGHSFGGRMSTHFAAEHPGVARGVVCYSFPLHPNKKPATKRAQHLHQISVPMLFLSGTRDGLADPELMRQLDAETANLRIHWLNTADHSYKVLKRTRSETEGVYEEAARVSADYINSVINRGT